MTDKAFCIQRNANGAMQRNDIHSSAHETMPLLTFNFRVSTFRSVMDKRSNMPRGANGLGKINGCNTVRNFNSVVRYCTDVSKIG